MSLLELYGIKPAPAITDTAIATVITEQGIATMSLPTRRDPDCPRRLQVQTPCKHHEWNVLYWNEYAGVFSPISCTGCNITLNVCPMQPPIETPELAVEETAEPQAVESVEVSESACEAMPQQPYKYMILPGESRPYIHEVAEKDQPEYGLKAEQAYYLVRSRSLTEYNEQPIYWIVTWSYDLCRWLCPCPDPHRSCAHTRVVNQDCKQRAIEANMAIVLAAFQQVMDENGCCEHEDLVQASGLDSLKVKQAIRFLNDAGEQIVWMRSEFPYWQWHNVTTQKQEAA